MTQKEECYKVSNYNHPPILFHYNYTFTSSSNINQIHNKILFLKCCKTKIPTSPISKKKKKTKTQENPGSRFPNPINPTFFPAIINFKLITTDHYLRNPPYVHCFDLNLLLDNNEATSFPTRFAPKLGLRSVTFPATKHGSDPFSRVPMHHPPGTIISGPRESSSESIRSRTGSSRWNFRAKGALLSIILRMWSVVR